ncbi:hypothetical protein V6N11_032550 [Hibiscus sabdariffa]|uniref:Plant bHLH transcription factor ACT-like domain-containing protein n=1 Tax=Hibiscus sabdariffa TaxID=183260 RepID=A0ABR2T1S4_9ROSI
MTTKLITRTATSRRKLHLLQTPTNPKSQEVKVEKIGEEFVVKVSCSNKGGEKLVSVLEAFDELGLDVVRASVACSHLFSMEAIAVAQGQQATGIKDITHAVLKAIDEKGRREDGDACNIREGVH